MTDLQGATAMSRQTVEVLEPVMLDIFVRQPLGGIDKAIAAVEMLSELRDAA
jgi:hypothetical protein